MAPTPPPIHPNQRRPGRGRIVGWVVAALVLAYCGFAAFMTRGMFLGRKPSEEDYAHNVKEREASAKALGISGTIALALSDEVTTVDLASGKPTTRFTTSGNWRTWGVAGPNRNGLLVFTENDMTAKRHRLHVLDTRTGKDRVLFERPGDALWEQAIMNSMAVAGHVDVAVIAVGVGNEQLYDPQAYMSVCELQQIDLRTGGVRRLPVRTLESRIAITDDGQQVYFVASRDRKEAEWLRSPKGPKPTSGTGDPTPVVCRLDVARGHVEPIYPGWQVCLDPENRSLAIADYAGELTLYDLASGKATPYPVPNYLLQMLGFAPHHVLIGDAKQARLEDVRMTEHNGLPGPRPMPRIVAYDPKARAVSTLYKAYDFRNFVSYSPWASKVDDQKPSGE